MNEQCIQLLNGYLLSLKRLSLHHRDYWVKSFEYRVSTEIVLKRALGFIWKVKETLL